MAGARTRMVTVDDPKRVGVTGERIRDKITASKRKGLWMGGVPSLGYDVVNRKLVINDAEATVVRRIFAEYPRVGSTTMQVAQSRLFDHLGGLD